MTRVLVLALLLPACATPTLQQRQDNWRLYRDSVRATCIVGKAEPARPEDVAEWRERAVEP